MNLRAKLILILVLFSSCGFAQGTATGFKGSPDEFWKKLWQDERAAQLRRLATGMKGDYNWQYELRGDLDQQSSKLLFEFEKENRILHDGYLDDYLNQQLLKVVGPSPIEGRQGFIHVIVLKSGDINAFAMDEGTVILTTALLAFVQTESELLGVISHEVAHVVLDHGLQNYSSAKSSESLANFLGFVGAVAGSVVAAKNNSNLTGREVADIGFWSGVFVSELSKGILDIIGASYSRSQEELADHAAVDFLNSRGMNGREYGDFLLRMGEHNKKFGLPQTASLLSTHPNIKDRLEELEYKYIESPKKTDVGYDRHMVDVFTRYAAIQILKSDFAGASFALDRALESGWATERAYLLKAIVLRHQSNDPRIIGLALALLDTAEMRRTEDYSMINSERGLLYLRIADHVKAQASFDAYVVDLSKSEVFAGSEELAWAKGMAAKCRVMK